MVQIDARAVLTPACAIVGRSRRLRQIGVAFRQPMVHIELVRLRMAGGLVGGRVALGMGLSKVRMVFCETLVDMLGGCGGREQCQCDGGRLQFSIHRHLSLVGPSAPPALAALGAAPELLLSGASLARCRRHADDATMTTLSSWRGGDRAQRARVAAVQTGNADR